MAIVTSSQGLLAGLARRRWVRFLVRRLRRFVIAIWVLMSVAFLMVHLIPGDPVRQALGPTAPATAVAAVRHSLGLDQPWWRQYLSYFGHVLTGDLGTSLSSQLPVASVIGQRLPATLALIVPAFVVAIVIAVGFGVLFAVVTRGARAPRTELGFTASSTVLGVIPEFLLGVGLVFVFGVTLKWLPVAQRAGLSSYVLPVAALALGPAAILARIVRVEMLAVLDADYIRTARGKRMGPLRVYLRHALPNALTASLTLGGLLLSTMIGSTVLVENVFAWPGLGSKVVSSIVDKDYPVVQSIVLVYGGIVLVSNLIVDLVLARLDPRSTIGAG